MFRLAVGAALLVGLAGTLAAFTAPSADAPAPLASLFPAGTYTVDKDHTEIGFSVRHLGISNVTGQFTDFDATLDVDPARTATMRTTATVRTASVDTRNARRDEHLRSADFFEVERYPTMTFASTGVRNVRRDGRFQLLGTLTLHGVTRPVMLDARRVGTSRGPTGDTRIAFTAETTINREQFGLTWNRAVETGGVVVGRDVRVRLEVQAIQQG